MKRELSGDKEGALRDAAGRDRERQRGKEGGGERKGPAPRDVAVVADALGTVSLQDSCELNFFCDLPAWCTDSLEDLQEPRDFVAIAVALGRLRIRDSTTLLALVAAASVIMQKCSLQQVASMMTAFARLRFRNTTLLSVCAEKVQTVLCADLGVKAFAEGHAEEAASIKGISEKARQTLSSGSRRIQKRRGRAASPFCPTAHVKSVVPLVSAFGRLEFDAGGLFAIFGDWLVLYSEQTDREEPHGRTMVLREESQTEGLGIDRGGRLGIQEWREILLSFAKVGRVHSGVLERAVSSLEGSCGPDWPNSAFSKEEGSRRSPSSVSSAEKINNKLSIHQQLSVLQALRVLRHPGEGSRLLLEICRGLQSVFGRMPLVVDEKRAGVPGVQLELENVTRALDCLAFLAPSCWHWPPQVLLGEVEGGGERSSSFVWDLLRESGSCLISALEGQRSAAGRLCARRGNHRRESPPLILNGNVGGPDLRTLSQVVVAVSHTLSLFVPSLPSIPPSEVAVSSSSSPGQIPGGSPDTGSPDFLPAVDHLQRLISVALLGLARKRTRTRERTDLIANGNAAALVSSLSALLLLQSHNGMSRKGGFFGSECKNWKNVEDMDCASGEANSHLPQDVETGEVGSRLLEENFGLNFFSDKERGEDSGEGGSWSNNQMGALRSVFPTACAALDVVRVLDVEPHRGVRAALPSEAWSPPGRRGRRRRRKVGEGSSDEDDEDEGEDEWVCDWRSLAGDDVAYPPQRSSSQGRSHPVASDGLLRVQLSKDSEAVRKTLVRLSPPPLSSGSEETAQSSAQADSVAAPGLEKEAPFLRRFGFRLGERIFGRRGGQVSLLSVDFVLPPERER
uniref:Uncharacterized protein n=1 Tax=Chromera velia CCMP2878 TaxID=1169474 RepID=A0A0G4IEZ2_9ALVE|eukprot:Cvel_2415.t1-p1 / transcript=Cvel_2415.t1 / gene=Cvel_2415 / organism=Chromera_velia_CCMP2878 / gene_product=hypothetical protein / transcript_product=hypothetical protein / location=Cvel_scaffold94:85691-92609(-) / protein_length=850 / sequence_SO=supercontig / SO=protein_coding / is_pseudo=false